MEEEGTIDFQRPDIAKWICAVESQTLFAVLPDIPSDFEHDERNRKLLPEHYTQSEDIPFLAREIYLLSSEHTPFGEVSAQVYLQRPVFISAIACLATRVGLTAAQRNAIQATFGGYDFDRDGEDLEAYMSGRVPADVDGGMYEIVPGYSLAKGEPLVELDVSQRQALFDAYGKGNGESRVRTRIDALPGGDTSLAVWARQHNVEFKLLGREAVLEAPSHSSEPIFEVPATAGQPAGHAADGAIDQIITTLVDAIVDGDCGVMNPHHVKLMTLLAWPEFKLEWRTKRIRIWRIRITIRYPAIRIRISSLVFYAYYSVPENVVLTAIAIADTCAKRAALESAIVGIVLSNLAAAIASFQPLFVGCVKTEITRCLYNGLTVVKEPGPWH